MYLCIFDLHYVEPTIKITTTIVQCRYIYVSWININAEICSDNEYFVTLSYQDRYQRTRRSFNTNQNNTDFNYLSDNTIYNFTVNAITLPERNSPTSNVEFLSLRTPVLQSTYVYAYIHMYVHIT